MVALNFYNREKRPWPNPRLKRASIIGHTTATSVRLWFRVSTPGDYFLLLSTVPIPTGGTPQILRDGNAFQCFVSTSEKNTKIDAKTILKLSFTYKNDLTNVVDLTHLKPDTRYYYVLLKHQLQTTWEIGYDETLFVQTFPENPTELTFGIYSCHLPYDGVDLVKMDMWTSFYQELVDVNARFVLALGDQVYVDGNENLDIWKWLRKVKHLNPTLEDMISWYRDIYRGYWGMVQLQRLFSRFPIYMLWDDHDIKDGWGSYTPAELAAQLNLSWRLENPQKNLELSYKMFQAAKQVYYEYQHSHNPPTDYQREVWDYSFDYGPCSFYCLDMRGHRDFNRPSRRILGEPQWQRFETWINSHYSSPAKILFIVSPVPVVHADSFLVNLLDLPYLKYTDDLRDHWENEAHWEERNQMLSALFQLSQKKQCPVVFLSGDVHLGAAFKISHPHFPNAEVFQLTSSPITYANVSKFERQLLNMLVKEHGYLGDFPQGVPYQFQNLYVCRSNNFGMVKVAAAPNGELTATFDLLGNTGKADGTIEKKRINLIVP